MVHITKNHHPLCHHSSLHRCQFSTRREAFDAMLLLEKRYPKDTFQLVKGPCPTNRGDK